MGDREYTLDELVAETGFSKRQIRYYITEKLVPGAGDQRGPHAVYGEETRRRLDAIAALKVRQIGPTGRALSLAEIRHSLDTGCRDVISALGGSDPDELVSQVQALCRLTEHLEPPLSTLGRLVGTMTSDTAADYLRLLGNQSADSPDSTVQDSDPLMASIRYAMESAPVPPKASHDRKMCLAAPDGPPIADLLHRLHDLLTELGSDTRFTAQVSENESWRRLKTPDVEIQVRTPDTMGARQRLNRMAAELGRLLARED